MQQVVKRRLYIVSERCKRGLRCKIKSHLPGMGVYDYHGDSAERERVGVAQVGRARSLQEVLQPLGVSVPSAGRLEEMKSL